MFGHLQGLSNLQAYKQVGDAIHARGGFDHLASQGQSNQGQAKPVVVQPNTSKEEEDRKERKRAAGSPQPASASAAAAKDFNPLALSDDDFSKLVRSNYL
jgi:hypothetical protein